MLLHGMMSTIAEFCSRNLAAQVIKGMDQNIAQGGTPTKALIGYHAAIREHDPKIARAARNNQTSWQTVDDLLTAMDGGDGSSKPSMVPLEGLEPPTLSLGRNCSSIELQRLTAQV